MSIEELRATALRCLPEVNKEYLGDVLYQQWSGPFMPHILYERIKEFRFRPEDIMSMGWPRSGNHWTYYLLSMILDQKPVPTSRSWISSIPDIFTDEEREAADQMPSPRLFCTHTRFWKIPQIATTKPKVVYLFRNPKDAMVSYYKLMCNFAPQHRFVGTWNEFFDVCLAGTMTWGSWFDHILFIEKYMRENPEVPVYLHQFEDMKTKPVECVKRLCAFLGVSDDLAEQIVEASGVESVKSAVRSQEQDHVRYFTQEETGYIQKGAVGYWRKTFTVDQNERFNKVFEEKMAGSKIAELVRKFIY